MPPTNDEALDDLIAFILATASRDDDWQRRSLGLIHLLKYAYLADLYMAEARRPSLTGATWRFHHFGPWEQALCERIQGSLNRLPDVQPIDIPNRFDDDRRHWRMSVDDDEYEEILRRVPPAVRPRLRLDIKRLSNVTEVLLDSVYRTAPMLTAAPGELLRLDAALPIVAAERLAPAYIADEPKQQSVAKRRKKLQGARDGVRAMMAAWRAERAAEDRAAAEQADPPPRYDEVFRRGTMWLDSLAGEPLREESGTLSIDDTVWHSPDRGGGDGG